MRILAADFVLPISTSPIEGGAIVIDDDRIVAVGTRSDISQKFPDVPVKDLGLAAILPGFVNTHSHLEATSMRGALDAVEHDFKLWLLKLNEIRSGLSAEDIEAAATLGASEGARAGVTCFGDIGRCGEAGLRALTNVGLRGILFQETEFSPDNATAEADLDKLKSKIDALRLESTDLVEVGVSPHSPYTVSRRLFELIAGYASVEKLKVSVHAAESAGEENLLRNGEGFFMQYYERVGVEWEVPHCSPVEFLDRTGILDTRPLLAHCVTVSDADIDLIARKGGRIAHCPKSNAKFGHGHAPFKSFLDAGIAVGLGSDSVASNNVCDLLEESRFAALAARNRDVRTGFINAAKMLEVATLGGARALGLDEKIGTLESGKQADLAVVSLSALGQSPINDVEAALVFSSNARDVVTTMVAGKVVFESGLAIGTCGSPP